ncbi:MAG TPA: DsrE family protein [Bryobacteraceae bacterium]|nr:DsrE family protein [Bryobacteraceae bacterium]
MTKKTIVCVVAVALIAVLAALSQTPSSPKHHVVFQMTEPEGPEWQILILHVKNLQEAFAKDGGSQVEVVFFGRGLNMLRKTNTAYEERLKQLADSGVKLAACQNAMRLMNVKTEDLFPFAAQVDSGVAEIARKQEAGWAYIH